MLLQRLATPAKLYYRLSLARGEIIMHVPHSRFSQALSQQCADAARFGNDLAFTEMNVEYITQTLGFER